MADHRRAADEISELVVQPGQSQRPPIALKCGAPGAGNRGTVFSQSYDGGGTQPDGCRVVVDSLPSADPITSLPPHRHLDATSGSGLFCLRLCIEHLGTDSHILSKR